MADGKRLIGDDGKLVRCSISGVAETTTLTSGWWKIAAKATSGSIFDAAAGDGDLEVGDFFYNPSDSLALTTGDTAYKITTTDMGDLVGWSLELSADEVETTVMIDTYKKYRKGKLDANGSATFTFIRGTTDDVTDGLSKYFFKTASISKTGSLTNVTLRSDDSLYLIGYIDNELSSDDSFLATMFQVEFFNFSFPMNSSEAVQFEVPFRLVGDTDPILYKVTNA
jgi:hypothetical protein